MQSLTVSQLNAFSNNEPHRTCLVLLNTILLLNVCQRIWSVGTFWSLHKSERKNYDYLSRGTFVWIQEIGQLSARVAGAVLILHLVGPRVSVSGFEIHSTSIHFSSRNCDLNRSWCSPRFFCLAAKTVFRHEINLEHFIFVEKKTSTYFAFLARTLWQWRDVRATSRPPKSLNIVEFELPTRSFWGTRKEPRIALYGDRWNFYRRIVSTSKIVRPRKICEVTISLRKRWMKRVHHPCDACFDEFSIVRHGPYSFVRTAQCCESWDKLTKHKSKAKKNQKKKTKIFRRTSHGMSLIEWWLNLLPTAKNVFTFTVNVIGVHDIFEPLCGSHDAHQAFTLIHHQAETFVCTRAFFAAPHISIGERSVWVRVRCAPFPRQDAQWIRFHKNPE